MLGGNVNYTNSNSNSDANYEDFSTFSHSKTNQFTLNPQVGFTLNNSWILGVYGNVSSSKTTSENNWLAIELSTNLVTFTHSDNILISNSNSNSFDFGLNASAIHLGVSFFLNNK
tara:strand:- start:1075 stop:1419 length:345 start_codon:yes stop_codon:yes gene_type:complete